MKVETSAALLAMLGVAAARPDAVRLFKNRHAVGASAKFRREVPQEHSHNKFLTGVRDALNLNNVDQVQDPVFALLGNAAAAQGAGLVQDLDCLQQRVADQAFTNAKAANDVDGMANALIFRALVRVARLMTMRSCKLTYLLGEEHWFRRPGLCSLPVRDRQEPRDRCHPAAPGSRFPGGCCSKQADYS